MTNRKTAIITGTSGNLGPIWTEVLESLGMKVYGIDLPGTDISIKQEVDFAVKDCLDKYDRPSIVICNAAIDNPPKGEATLWDNYNNILNVNLKGHFHLLSQLLPGNVKHPCLVVMISSIMAHSGADWRRYADVGLPKFTKPAAYNASKAGLMALSKCITTEYGRYGIRGVSLSFGPVDTGKFDPVFKERILKDIPMGRLVTVDDLKASLIHAINNKSFAGNDCLVDGGLLSW